MVTDLLPPPELLDDPLSPLPPSSPPQAATPVPRPTTRQPHSAIQRPCKVPPQGFCPTLGRILCARSDGSQSPRGPGCAAPDRTSGANGRQKRRTSVCAAPSGGVG